MSASDPDLVHHQLMGCEPTSAVVARRALASMLMAHDIAVAVVADATHVLHELVMNGIEHGRPDGDGMIEVSWTVTDSRLAVTVRDSGTPDDGKAVTRLAPTPDLARGRGLAMVEAFSDQWQAERGASGTSVTAIWLLPR